MLWADNSQLARQLHPIPPHSHPANVPPLSPLLEIKSQVSAPQDPPHKFSLFNCLHLLLNRHSPNAEGTAQWGQTVLLQQATVVLNDAMGLPGQLSLQREKTPQFPTQGAPETATEYQ